MITRLIKFLSKTFHSIKFSEYILLRRSILFDPNYYLKKYPDLGKASAHPILHYLYFGHLELRQPSEFFDPIYYMKQLPSAEDIGQDPVTHYLQEGYKLNLRPNPLFDPTQYVQENPTFNITKKNPYLDFLTNNAHSTAQCCLTPYFDPEYYCNRYTDVKKSTFNPYYHYIKMGIDQGRRPSVWFHAPWYQDRYNLTTSPLTHYLVSGVEQRKSPSPLFDPDYYAENYQLTDEPDLFKQYLDNGLQLDHKPCNWFDPKFYQEHYLEDNQTVPSPLHHFLTTGLKNGFYPNEEIYNLNFKPLISILVPVYNADTKQLNNCIRSILYQSYPHWELCLADDCSTHDTIRPLIEQWTAQDTRIKSVFLDKNSGISNATNTAAKLATGDYIGLLDNDDELSLEALAHLVKQINTAGGDLFYSDEDLIGEDARQHSIFRKPAFNRELLLSHNYVTHFLLIKRSLYEKVGGCDSRYDGAQDFDLMLKLSEQAEQITHIPKILYHWRATQTSTSIDHSQKDYAHEAGKRAIEAALLRRNISASVSDTELKFYYRVKRQIIDQPSVTLIICFESEQSDPIAWLSNLLNLTNYPLHKIVVVCNSENQLDILNGFEPDSDIQIDVISHQNKTIGLASAYNAGCKDISSEFLLFVSDKVSVSNSNWIESLIEYGQLNDAGMVGGKLSCIEESQEPVTHIPDCNNQSPNYFSRFVTNSSVLMNGRHCPQDVLSVNLEFCLIKTDLFNEMEGFDDQTFPYLFGIHDLCYRLNKEGKTNIFTPYAQSFWRSPDQKRQPSPNQEYLEKEREIFQQKWQSILQSPDPFYNRGIVSDANKSTAEFITWLTGEHVPKRDK